MIINKKLIATAPHIFDGAV